MGVLDWLKGRSGTSTQTKRTVVRPNKIDRKEDLVVNSGLTRGLYHNTYPGLKLAGALGYNPIAIPVSFMGLPIPQAATEATQDAADQLILDHAVDIRQINTEANRDGTSWVWPWYDSEARKLKWELIPDDSVTRILLDIRTMEPTTIYVEEEIELSTGDDGSETIEKRRIFTKETVRTEYTPNAKIPTEEAPNVIGILPIVFANLRDSGEIRGHSDYERIVPDLAAYSEIYQAMVTDLAKFKTKMVQEVADLDKWLDNNGFTDITEIDITTIDLILNLKETEGTTFETAEKVADGYISALKVAFRKVVEGSGIPEIAWGLKTEGNMASVEENMEILIRYVNDKRDQYTEAYKVLISASLRLLGIATMQQDMDLVDVTWDALSATSDSVRAEIFQKFADSVSKLIDSAGWTKQQLFNMWKLQYPETTDEEFEEFVVGIQDMAGHKAFKDAAYLDQLDAAGALDGGDEA